MQLKFYNNIIGRDIHGDHNFIPYIDDIKSFEKNLSKMPNDWYYRTHPITYNFNSYGHRCEEISSIDFNNYILFLGDSNTVGIGLELEKTYSYIVSKNLGMSYYNLGLSGTGIDVMFYNLNMWLNGFPKPKYVVLFWSDISRFFTESDISKDDQYISIGSWSKNEIMRDMLVYGIESGYFETRFILYNRMVTSLFESRNITEYANISLLNNKYAEHTNFERFMFNDHARDLSHLGIQSNQKIANYLINKFNS